MRSFVRALLVGAAAIGLSSVVAAAGNGLIDAPAAVDEVAVRAATTDPPEPLGPALLVSDSAWLGLRSNGAIDAVQGFAHRLDLGSCRRRVVTSCTNYNGHVPITLRAELDVHGDGYDTLIVATGYNDSDRAFGDEFAEIVGRARELGYERIVWLTLRADVTYVSPGAQGFAEVFANNNAALASLVGSGQYPDVTIADWATYARDRDEWFATDGIHLSADGGYAAADFISRKMAHLDGRPCPQPLEPGGPIADPCPDPDASPPLADILALYPVGVWNDTYGFELEFEGAGSWPDPPWWER